MITPAQLDQIRAIANFCHLGQFRNDGVTPYIYHPEAVCSSARASGANLETQALCLTHDIFEETPKHLHAGIELKIRAVLTPEDSYNLILRMKKISRTRNQEYETYLVGLLDDPILAAAKYHDMLQNLSGEPKEKSFHKYLAALPALREIMWKNQSWKASA